MTTKQLNYKALPIIAAADGATTPTISVNDKGAMAFSTTTNKPMSWDGTKWNVVNKVDSVAGKTGAVTVTKADVGLSNVDNVASASLRDRTTHTGEQAISSVTGLQTALDGKSATTHTHAAATTTVAGFMSNTDKTKLDGIAAGANNYAHPANHPASIITQDSNNRFVTDAEKTTWNAKIGSVKTINGQSIVGTGDIVIPTGSSDPLDLSASNPSAPPIDKVRIFGRNVGGRIMPAFKGPSGLDSSLQASLARNKIALASPHGGGSTTSTIGMTLAVTGANGAEGVATTNLYTAMKRAVALVTTASATAVAGYRSSFAQYFRGAPGGKIGGFHFVCRFGPAIGQSIQTTRRGFCGFSSSFAAPTAVNPSTLPHVLGVGCDATDANYFILHRTGALAVTKIDTGISKSANDASKVYELAMFCAPGSSTVEFEFTDLTTDVVFRHTANTNLPSPDALLAPQVYYAAGGIAGQVGTALMNMYIETDY